ncbi:MAG: 3-hydroxyacyl-CoA dehydrogenase NAD-binding domain-containing protein [Pirellulales bacterium]
MAASSALALTFPVPDIAVLTFHDPLRSTNVLSRQVLDELARLLDSVAAQPALAGLVVCSSRPGVFLAGADVHELAGRVTTAGAADVAAACRRGCQLLARLASLPLVTVAAIDGVCLGGGAELASWCDYRVVADAPTTSVGWPEVKLGMFPGWGGTVRLPRLIGPGPASEWITSGEPQSAATVRRAGWADDLAPPAQLLEVAFARIRLARESGEYRAARERRARALPFPTDESAFLRSTTLLRIRERTKGHEPAPEIALDLILDGCQVDQATACDREADRLAAHWGTPTHRALFNVFQLREQHRQEVRLENDAAPRPVRTVGIAGAGLMGSGIAGVTLRRDFPVCVFDASPQALERGCQQILDEAAYDRQHKGPDPQVRARLATRLVAAPELAALAPCDLVIEAIVENPEAKRQLFAELEPRLAPDAILASNTSTIPITRQAAELQHPERFCGMHFFNPVRRLPLVEIIRGRQTSDATVAAAVSFARRIGKSPIVVGDGPGFLVNRLLFPYLNEALQLLGEGVPLEDIESAAVGFGMPMGPLELYDMVGIDTAVFAGRVIWQAFPERVKPSPILPALLKAGRLGKKSGAGFFRYATPHSARETDPALATVIGTYCASPNRVSPEWILDRLLLPMLLEGTRTLEDRIVVDPRTIDFGVMFGLGFPAFRGGLCFWADQQGLAPLVARCEPWRTLGPRFDPPRLLRELAESGRGFYSLPGTPAAAHLDPSR